MNDFEIVRAYIHHVNSMLGPMFSGLADVKTQKTDDASEAMEALDRIEEEYKNMENVISSEWG